MAKIEYSMLARPIPGQTCCGDIPWVKKFNNHILLCLIDAAGHGCNAESHAEQCISILEKNYQDDLRYIIESLHVFSKGKRGLVIGLALIEINSGIIHYMGVGNISACIWGKQKYRFVSRIGVLGSSVIYPIMQEYLLNNEDILLMYSDGITNRLEKEYPGILTDEIETIPKAIISKYGKNNDDASCLAARYIYD